jgi:hypothetical protein
MVTEPPCARAAPRPAGSAPPAPAPARAGSRARWRAGAARVWRRRGDRGDVAGRSEVEGAVGEREGHRLGALRSQGRAVGDARVGGGGPAAGGGATGGGAERGYALGAVLARAPGLRGGAGGADRVTLVVAFALEGVHARRLDAARLPHDLRTKRQSTCRGDEG